MVSGEASSFALRVLLSTWATTTRTRSKCCRLMEVLIFLIKHMGLATRVLHSIDPMDSIVAATAAGMSQRSAPGTTRMTTINARREQEPIDPTFRNPTGRYRTSVRLRTRRPCGEDLQHVDEGLTYTMSSVVRSARSCGLSLVTRSHRECGHALSESGPSFRMLLVNRD